MNTPENLSAEQMPIVKNGAYFVGIRFNELGKAYYFSTDIPDLKINELVVVAGDDGYEIGTVCTIEKQMSLYKSDLPLKPIARRPTKDDISEYEFNIKENKQALEIAQTEVTRLNLPMHLLDANYTLDGSKLTINFTADGRIDFRELVRNLASQLRCRIDMHQIFSRDKAKVIGGIGICGLPLCCSTFLDSFDGISIGRAKNQMLTLNIPKLSGPCGKLICCLVYEDDAYTEAKKDFPRIGSVLHIGGKEYTVQGMNVLSRTLKLVGIDDVQFMSLDDVLKATALAETSKPVQAAIVQQTVSDAHASAAKPSVKADVSNSRSQANHEKK